MKKSLSLYLRMTIILLVTACSATNEPVAVKFEGKYFEKKWALPELNRELTADWSQFEYLTFEMRSSTTQKFELRIFDTSGVRRLTIQPMQGAWVRASVPLIHFRTRNTKGMDLAAIGKTARPGYWIGFSSMVGSISHVDSLSIAMRLPIGTPTVELRNFELTMDVRDTVFGPVPLVDDFGQWIPAEWPGKASDIDNLMTYWAQEDKELQPGKFNISKYGGFKEKKVKATGYFRVEQVDGKWWFVDPEGYLFYSTGSTGIGPRSEVARIKGREYIFKSMPPSEEIAAAMPVQNLQAQPSNQNRPPAAYSFFTWNLYRRFGQDWYKKWSEFTIRRMDNWGLNTIANWSDANLGANYKKTYVATLRGWGIETGIMGMPDVYDPGYEKMVDEAAERQCAPRKNDPYLLGYFIGNEPAWPNREAELVNVILKGDATPMQSELKKFLEAGDTPERRREFVFLTYEKFIKTVNNAIKKHDPNHLNMGLRFGGSAPEAIVRASKGFDVFSFNSYGYTVNPENIKRFYDITGLPMIIGEFHFGVPERGLAPGLAQTISQEERGVAYRYYVENAAAHPAIVGTHWFQWIDQPCTGRNDGENYNIGFVDVTDRPYAELVGAAQETFGRLYLVHSGAEAPVSRKALTQ